MGAPRTEYSDKLQGAMIEILSAISALNMPPQPMSEPVGNKEFLSETDHWVAHAIEHLEAATKLIRERQ